MEIRRGKKRWGEVKASLGRRKLSAWVCAIGGAGEGPTLALLAGQHGMEPTGPAVLSALVADLRPRDLSGNLLVVPLVYANAIRHGYECEPIGGRAKEAARTGRWHNQCPYALDRNKCGRNFNRMWHGGKAKTVYERLAAALWEQVIVPAQYVIDFHCWQDWAPPGVLTTNEAALELGKWAGISWIHHRTKESPLDKVMLAERVCASGRVGLTIEFTPQTRIMADMAAIGRYGIENVMRRLGMLRGRPTATRPLYLLGQEKGDWRPVKAKSDVLVLPTRKPGDWVTQGQAAARVVEIDRPWKMSVLKAPCDGIVYSTEPSSSVRKGAEMMLFRKAKRLA
jgi:predicted deacylase